MAGSDLDVNKQRFFIKDVWGKQEETLIKTKKNDKICIGEGK